MRLCLCALSVAALALIASCTTADAACTAGKHLRTFVGQPADLYFTAGVAETKHVPQTWVMRPVDYLSTDCGAVARSTLPSVTVTQTYCVWSGTLCATGQIAAIDDAGGVAGVYVNYEQDHVRPVAVNFDGSAPAGTAGLIEFGAVGEVGNLVGMLGSVNVYVVAPGSPVNWFTITTDAANINGDGAYIDRRNLTASSKVFVMHQHTGANWDHPIAAVFDRTMSRWKIRNEDGVQMPAGLSFVVRVDPTALKVSTSWLSSVNYIRIDDPRSNNNPYATIVATPWSSGPNRMNHPYGVAYTPPHWQVMVTDGKSLPRSFRWNSSGFFVKIIGASQYADDARSADPSGFTNTHLSNGAGIDLNGVGNTRASGAVKYLRRFCWTQNPAVPALATLNITPLPPPAPVNYNFNEGRYYGVGIAGGVSMVVHEDSSRMFEGAPFNVWGDAKSGCPPRRHRDGLVPPGRPPVLDQ